MARRILDTAFWDDTDVAALSYPERLLLICMITDEALSNDYGWLPAHSALLKKHAFGYDNCTVSEVEAWRDAILEKCKNVKLYVVNDQEYIDLIKFPEWQKIRYKRKTHLPPPPWWGEETPDTLIPETSRNSAETSRNFPQNTESSRPTVTKPPLGSVGLGSDGQSGEGLGSEGLRDQAAAASADTQMPEQLVTDILQRPITRSDRKRWRRLIADYGPKIAHYALNEALECGGRTWAYVATVAEAEHERQSDEANQGNTIRGPP